MKKEYWDWVKADLSDDAFMSSGGESGCARECVEANDSAGSGIDRNCEDTMQGDRPAAVVKVPPPDTVPPAHREET